MTYPISPWKKFVEGHTRHHRQSECFPFIAGWSTGKAKSGESIEMLSYSPIERCDQPVSFAVDEWDTGGGECENTAHEIFGFIGDAQWSSSPRTPIGAMSVYEIASEGIAPMRQLHNVPFQRILAHARVHPALIGIVRYDEVWRGLARALEPAIAGLIGKRQFERV